MKINHTNICNLIHFVDVTKTKAHDKNAFVFHSTIEFKIMNLTENCFIQLIVLKLQSYIIYYNKKEINFYFHVLVAQTLYHLLEINLFFPFMQLEA